MANSVVAQSLAGGSSGSPIQIFGPTDRPCASYNVYNRDAAIIIFVRIPGLHDPTDPGAAIQPGENIEFASGGLTNNGITSVFAWPASGSPVIDGYVVSRH